MVKQQIKKEGVKCTCAHCKLSEIKIEIEESLEKVKKQLKDTAHMLYTHNKYWEELDQF